jgi:glycosyltransferase involved in cell wall biosynthesis
VLEQITPLIITLNEAKNIRRTLENLTWARRIVVIDSGSTDETIDIIGSYPQVDVINHAFVSFADQCNFGLTQVTSQWVLSLDADYVLSDEFVAEIKSLMPSAETKGYRARFIYQIYGRSLHGTLYPPRIVLYRKNKAVYENEGHGHRVLVQGKVIPLSTEIFHDDRKSLAYWFTSQQRYARQEAEFLLSSDRVKLKTMDRIRLAVWPAPLAVFFYTLLIKGCLLDGWPGWYYALQRMLAEVMIGLEIIDKRLRRGG